MLKSRLFNGFSAGGRKMHALLLNKEDLRRGHSSVGELSYQDLNSAARDEAAESDAVLVVVDDCVKVLKSRYMSTTDLARNMARNYSMGDVMRRILDKGGILPALLGLDDELDILINERLQ